MRSSILVVALSLGVAACGGEDLILPKDGEPARITVVSDASPRQIVGQPLDAPLVARVTDPGGRPVANVEVLFVPPPGASVEPSGPVTTGADGQASVSYVLSPVAGEQVVEARAPIEPPTNAVATIRIQADPDVPQGLVEDGGNQQQAQVSTVLPQPLAVKAVDRFGNGVPGVEVTWEVDGGGSVDPATVMTGADGRAVTTRLLGDRPGPYGTVAVAEALAGATVPFTATAIAAPRPELVLVTQPSSTAAAGVSLEQQPVIQLQDPTGAPLNQEGVRVTVQVAGSSGSVGGRTTATSTASGLVTFTDLELRGDTGSRTLIFSAAGFVPVTSTEITVQPGPPAPGQSSLSVPDGNAGVPTTIRVRLRDEFGNSIPGAASDLTINIAGANPTSGLIVTDDGDGAYTASYVPVHSGTDIVTLAFRGAPLGGEPSHSVVAPGPADPATTTATLTRDFFNVHVVVTTRDAHRNLLGHGGDQVQLQGFGSSVEAADAGNGTYTGTVLVFFGETLTILLNGEPIAGSPFSP